jgi:MFS family permease
VSAAARGARGAVGLGLAVAVVGVLPSFLLGALAVQMGRDLGFGPAGLGGATAAFFVVSAFGSVPLGLLADRLGGPRSLRACALGSAACCAAVAVLARSYPSLIAVLVAGGSGSRVPRIGPPRPPRARGPPRPRRPTATPR